MSKTLTADQDADAIGGSVNLVTKTPRARRAATSPASSVSRRSSRAHASAGQRDVGRPLRRQTADSAFCSAAPRITTTAGSTTSSSRGTRTSRARRFRSSGISATTCTIARAGARTARSTIGSTTARRCSCAARGASSRTSARLQLRHRRRRRLGAGVVRRDRHRHRGALTRNTSNRTPVEQLFSVNGGGKKLLGGIGAQLHGELLRHALDVDGRRNSSAFTYSGLNYRYDGSNHELPDVLVSVERRPGRGRLAGQLRVDQSSIGAGTTRGDEVGGQLDAHVPVLRSAQRRAAQDRREVPRREPRQRRTSTAASPPPAPLALTQVLGTFSRSELLSGSREGLRDRAAGESRMLTRVRERESVDVQGDDEADQRLAEQLHRRREVSRRRTRCTRSTWARCASTSGFGWSTPPSIFTGNVATTPATRPERPRVPQTVRRVTGTQNYTDLFPSVQLRYAVDAAQQPAIRRDARHRARQLLRPRAARRRARCARPARSSSPTCPSAIRTSSRSTRGTSTCSASTTSARRACSRPACSTSDHRLHLQAAVHLSRAGHGVRRLLRDRAGERRRRASRRRRVRLLARLDFLPGALSGLGFDVNWTQVVLAGRRCWPTRRRPPRRSAIPSSATRASASVEEPRQLRADLRLAIASRRAPRGSIRARASRRTATARRRRAATTGSFRTRSSMRR